MRSKRPAKKQRVKRDERERIAAAYMKRVIETSLRARPLARREVVAPPKTRDEMFTALTRYATGITAVVEAAPASGVVLASEIFTCTLHVCPMCRKRQSCYFEKQTRSSDEPMTQFIRCICGHAWRR